MLGYVLDAVAGPGLQEQLEVPSPAPGEALIRVLRSGVCSTDLEMILGYKDGFQGVLGHEFVGIVEAGTCCRYISWRGRSARPAGGVRSSMCRLASSPSGSECL